MNLNWETGYVLIVVITLMTSEFFFIYRFLEKYKIIPADFKNIYLSYTINIISNILSIFIDTSIGSNVYIKIPFVFLVIFSEITFLILLFKKIIEIPKKIVTGIYCFFATILVLIFTKFYPKLEYTFEIVNYQTIIYFLISIFSLYFLRIYLSRLSSSFTQTSIFNTPLNIILIGVFFCYGLSLPLDTIYSYMIFFEKAFFTEMINQNQKMFKLIKLTELLSFVILNLALIKSIKCFKPISSSI